MWSRKRIDVGWADLIFAATRSPSSDDRALLAAEIEQRWSPAGQAVVCLSVRSAFDLLLSSLDLPAGSEILVSAVTIGGMLRIIAEHGHVAVPVDLDAHHLAPRPDALARALSPRTKVVLVAHLFGGRIDLRPVVEFARRNDLILIEDAAQAYAGPTYTGHPTADVSLFSFGPIKTATALGGAIACVRDPQLLMRMRRKQVDWPPQKRSAYLARVLKYAALKASSSRPAYTALLSACRAVGSNHDRLVNGSVRGFADGDFFVQIRRQPSAALLSLLKRRLTGFDERRLSQRVRQAELLMAGWRGSSLFPGSANEPHVHWMLPLHTASPSRLIARLAAAGFDATQGHSLTVVQPPRARPELDPIVARAVMAGIVFVPCYSGMSAPAVERLARILVDIAGQESDPLPSEVIVAHGEAAASPETAPDNMYMPVARQAGRCEAG
ncbi:MAG TPA: DegT/DnrJ/EryC1/StrS family aminotransferase [Pirellulales bacterium]|nr:DegT/DnrJ/EryC1/StrS family aminotransferase [Pirellulales bacterium]